MSSFQTEANGTPSGRHAVRWASRMVNKEAQYTRWHLTDCGAFTLCGRALCFGSAVTTLPESEEPEKADCKLCLSRRTAKQ